VHRVTAEHESQGIPAQLDVRVGDDTRRFDLELGQERVVVPLTHAPWSVAIALRAR
jgi:hypothetical protein